MSLEYTFLDLANQRTVTTVALDLDLELQLLYVIFSYTRTWTKSTLEAKSIKENYSVLQQNLSC